MKLYVVKVGILSIDDQEEEEEEEVVCFDYCYTLDNVMSIVRKIHEFEVNEKNDLTNDDLVHHLETLVPEEDDQSSSSSSDADADADADADSSHDRNTRTLSLLFQNLLRRTTSTGDLLVSSNPHATRLFSTRFLLPNVLAKLAIRGNAAVVTTSNDSEESEASAGVTTTENVLDYSYLDFILPPIPSSLTSSPTLSSSYITFFLPRSSSLSINIPIPPDSRKGKSQLVYRLVVVPSLLDVKLGLETKMSITLHETCYPPSTNSTTKSTAQQQQQQQQSAQTDNNDSAFLLELDGDVQPARPTSLGGAPPSSPDRGRIEMMKTKQQQPAFPTSSSHSAAFGTLKQYDYVFPPPEKGDGSSSALKPSVMQGVYTIGKTTFRPPPDSLADSSPEDLLAVSSASGARNPFSPTMVLTLSNRMSTLSLLGHTVHLVQQIVPASAVDGCSTRGSP